MSKVLVFPLAAFCSWLCIKREVEIMTGKGIVNLIDVLREKDIPGDEIIRIIRYIETHEPRENEPQIKCSSENS